MKKDSTRAALFSLAISLGLTGALLTLVRWMGTRGFEDLAGSIFQGNPSGILAIFFGIYCGSMIFYIAVRNRRFPDHFRLLLLYCCFPATIGLVGSIVGSGFSPAEAEGISALTTSSSTTYYPFYLGGLASFINFIALITVYRSKEMRRSKRKLV